MIPQGRGGAGHHRRQAVSPIRLMGETGCQPGDCPCARPRKSFAQVVERWIIAAPSHQKCFRLEEVNRAIRELLERLNQRPFRKREGSRASVFASIERSALRSLPAERFDMSQWSRARVNIDYHIAFDANLYSVPYNLVQELVEVRATPTTVEIFHKGQRVASHLRDRGRGQTFT